LVRLAPKATLTYDIFLAGLGRNCQTWYFHQPGVYKLSAEYVTSLNSRIDRATGLAAKVDDAWTGTLRAPTIEFVAVDLPTAPDSAAVTGAAFVVGKVVDREGKPIAGAEVTVLALRPRRDFGDTLAFEGRPNEGSTAIDRLTSGPDGAFRFDALPEDVSAYKVVGVHGRYV
jgi:hypothetical protein